MTILGKARRSAALAAVLVLVLTACGSGSTTDAAAEGDRPTVVVTTSILGDVVAELVGDQVNVITVMPVGADPHDFQASAQEVDQLLEADALIVNGMGFEEGLLDVIDSATEAGVPTLEAIEAVSTLEFGSGGGHGDDEHGDEHSDEEEAGHDDENDEHSDEEEAGHDDENDEHSDEEEAGHDDENDEHGHGDVDPHFFTDPARMADAVRGIEGFLTSEVEGLDGSAVEAAAADYLAELEALDADVEELVDAIPEEQRILVTNHEVFGYFADRYGFEVVGAVIPGGSTADNASAGELAELAETVESEGVAAIFADTSSSDQLVETLAAEVGDIEVVELYSESLGESGSDGGTYLDMVRTNASRISAALS